MPGDDLADFAEVNRVYELFFPTTEYDSSVLPARSTMATAFQRTMRRMRSW